MKIRIITAIVALMVFIPFLVIGGIPFEMMALLLATIAIYELLVITKQRAFSINGIVTFLMTWIIVLPWQRVTFSDYIGITKLDILFIGMMILLIYTVFSPNKFHFLQAGICFISIFYVGFGFLHLIQARQAGLIYVLFALLIVWSTDTGAYFIGRAIGKRKLAPHISPNKTVEGFIGGILCTLLVAGSFFYFANLNGQMINIFFFLIVLSVFAQLGDLVASALKRYYDIKDSGNILPGHGGILDRFDSLLFVLPLLHILEII